MFTISTAPVRPTAIPWRIASRVPLTLAMAAVALLVAGAPPLAELLQFDRAAIAAGQSWRLATCHLAHWNFEHLQWDWLMFVVLGAVCERRDPRRMRWCVLVSAAAVSALVTTQFPEIAFYRGLSGIDTALFTLLAVDLLRDAVRDRNWLLATATGGMLYGFAAKTLFEAATGRTIFVDRETAGFLALVWDHVVAGVVGLACAVVFHFRTWVLAGGMEESLYPLRRKISRYKRCGLKESIGVASAFKATDSNPAPVLRHRSPSCHLPGELRSPLDRSRHAPRAVAGPSKTGNFTQAVTAHGVCLLLCSSPVSSASLLDF